MNVPFNLRAIQTEQFVSDGSYERLLCPAYQLSGLWNSKAAQSTCRRNHTKKEAQLEYTPKDFWHLLSCPHRTVPT
jgi:hypothetical protein